MKKILLILAVVGTTILSSCEGPQGVPGPQGTNINAEVFEIRNVNFGLDANNEYTIYRTLNPQILLSDNLLIYRLTGTIDSSTPIWKLVPNAVYNDLGEMNYDFDFSKEDFTIYASATYNPALTANLLNGQTFRIVIVPGYLSNKSAAKTVDLNDYNAVIKAYNINDSNIKLLN